MRMAIPIVALMLLANAGESWAFEVDAVIEGVDVAGRRVSFEARQQVRTATVAPDAKILDRDGRDLAGGLASDGLKAGATVTLSVERVGNRPVILAIRLGAGPVGAKALAPAGPAVVEKQDTSELVPLTDLAGRAYRGFAGGLYPDGKNARPADHEARGKALAAQIRPLDAEGKPDPDGKIVLLGIGFSNTVQAFAGFMEVAREDREINPKVVLVNGAVGGMSAAMVQDPDHGRGQQYWTTVDERLKAAGVSRAQVQAVWIKETNPAPHPGGFPRYVQDLQAQLGKIAGIVHERFPNVKLAFLSSRTYGGWAMRKPGGGEPGNSEPYSYESGFAVKWLIEQQLKGDPERNEDPARGPVKAPWLSWGPYLWTNAPQPRGDGVRFDLADFAERDRMHESPAGQRKVGRMLLQFFKTDPTTRGWFVRDAPPE